MAMRSIWKGTITFLLVAIPVKIYNAIESSEKISFNQLHTDCLGAIGYTKQCKKCGVVVTSDQIAKGYQHEPEQYVIIEPEEIATITPKSNEAIEIVGFIDPAEIPTTYFDASYFVAPSGPAAGKPYALLREVMRRTGKVGIGKVIMREREELVTISPNEEGLIIQKLHYRHEVRTITNVPGIANIPSTDESELQIAEMLVDKLATTFDKLDTVDHYHVALKGMLETKVAGGTIEAKPQATTTAPAIDIMAALKASLNTTPKATAPPAEDKAQPTLTLVPAVTTAEEKQPRKRRTA
jgi:DNA end-binding protein Ku